MPSLVDQKKVEGNSRFETFYDYLIARGYSRYQLSAYGIGRNIG